MLLSTHVATALAVAYVADAWYARTTVAYASSPLARLALFLVAALSQKLVDSIGHSVRSYRGRTYYARNALHSLPAMLAIGAGIGCAFTLASGFAVYPPTFAASLALHWLEDLVTEGGVPLVRGRVRLPLPYVSYDDTWMNRLAVLGSLALVASLAPPTSAVSLLVYLLVAAYGAYAYLRA